MRRSPYGMQEHPRCPSCGKDCADVGYKIRLPARRSVKSWDDLRESLAASRLERLDQTQRDRLRTRHELEQKLDKLIQLPENKGRVSLIRTLRKRLNGLTRE